MEPKSIYVSDKKKRKPHKGKTLMNHVSDKYCNKIRSETLLPKNKARSSPPSDIKKSLRSTKSNCHVKESKYKKLQSDECFSNKSKKSSVRDSSKKEDKRRELKANHQSSKKHYFIKKNVNHTSPVKTQSPVCFHGTSYACLTKGKANCKKTVSTKNVTSKDIQSNDKTLKRKMIEHKSQPSTKFISLKKVTQKKSKEIPNSRSKLSLKRCNNENKSIKEMSHGMKKYNSLKHLNTASTTVAVKPAQGSSFNKEQLPNFSPNISSKKQNWSILDLHNEQSIISIPSVHQYCLNENKDSVTSLEQQMDVDDTDYNDSLKVKVENKNIENRQDVVVILDTNVLLEDRSVVEDLRSSMYYGETMKVIIPYMVLQELDKLKYSAKSKEIEKEAQSAIKWCNFYFENEDKCIQGQTYEQYINDSSSVSGDDSIHNCCLFYKKLGKVVYLISNDVNLRNKALVSLIKSMSLNKLKASLHSKRKVTGQPSPCKRYFDNSFDEKVVTDMEIQNQTRLGKSKYSLQSEDSYSKIQNSTNSPVEDAIIKNLGGILEYALKDAYEDLWDSIVLYKPPWSVIQVLKCIEKHWVALFIEKFPTEVKNEITDIRQCLEQHNTGNIEKKVSHLFKLISSSPYRRFININLPQRPETTVREVSLNQEETEKQNISTVDGGLPSDFHIFKEVILEVGNHASSIINEIGKHLNLSKNFAVKDVSSINQVYQSLKILRSTLVDFGFLILNLRNCPEDASAAKFNIYLTNYWELAQQRCPNPFIFSEGSLKVILSTTQGIDFLSVCIKEFERLIQEIDSMCS